MLSHACGTGLARFGDCLARYLLGHEGLTSLPDYFPDHRHQSFCCFLFMSNSHPHSLYNRFWGKKLSEHWVITGKSGYMATSLPQTIWLGNQKELSTRLFRCWYPNWTEFRVSSKLGKWINFNSAQGWRRTLDKNLGTKNNSYATRGPRATSLRFAI